MAKKQTSLVKNEQALVVPDDTSLAAAFDGDKGLNVPINAVLPIVKILRESPTFQMPDGGMADSFRGHILAYHSVNQLYLEEYGADSVGKLPDCSSADGLVSNSGQFIAYQNITTEEWKQIVEQSDAPAEVANQPTVDHPIAQVWLNKHADKMPASATKEVCGMCAGCPASQFGSRSIEHNNKACQNSVWLYLLIDGYRTPVFMKAGPSSLGRKENYYLIPFLSNLPNIGLGGQYQTVSMQFSLQSKSFKSGFSGSCLILSDPKVIDPNSQDDLAKLEIVKIMYKSFKEKYLAAMQNYVAVDRNENVVDNGEF